jgi:tRNA nucleotidyltransferase (CCA-adding enzyme)
LRVYRAARFIARFNLHPTPELARMCLDLNPMHISNERVGMELMKTFKQADKPSLFFRFLFMVGWLSWHFDELLNLVATPQNPKWHPEGDAFEHTMHCIDQCNKGDWFTKTVMLCHDLGKAETTELVSGQYKSIGHELAGVPLTNKMLKRIHFTDHKTINQIKTLVKLHMIATLPEVTDKTVKKHLRELMSFDLTYDQLVEVCRCDKSGRPPLPPVTPNIGQDRAKQFIHDGVMIPVVTGELLQRHGFINNIEWGKIIKACLDFQDRGSLNISNWRKIMQDAGMLKLITPPQ